MLNTVGAISASSGSRSAARNWLPNEVGFDGGDRLEVELVDRADLGHGGHVDRQVLGRLRRPFR